MAKELIFMSRLPDDEEAQLEMLVRLSRRITGREPTTEEVAEARRILGLHSAQKDDG